MQLLQENIGENIQDTGLGKNFLSKTPQAEATKGKMGKWNHIKLKTFCTAKKTIKKVKGQNTKWEKIFSYYPSGKGLVA